MSELDIDAIKARLEDRRGLPVFLTDGDIAKTQENKQGVYRWYFHGTWDDAGFFAEAPGDIAALITEVETLRRQIDTVKKIHEPEEYENPNTYETGYMCSHCYQENGEWAEYPCETIRALEVAE